MNRLWRVLAGVLAALAGMQALVSCPKYGPSVPLEVISFNYSPPGPVHVGDALTFAAQLEPGGNWDASVFAINAPSATFRVQLHDDGQPPDVKAGDNVYTGSAPWYAEYGTGAMNANLVAHGAKHTGSHTGGAEQEAYAHGYAKLPLEVLP